MIQLAQQRCLRLCWVELDGQDRKPFTASMPSGVISAESLSFTRWRCRMCTSCCAAEAVLSHQAFRFTGVWRPHGRSCDRSWTLQERSHVASQCKARDFALWWHENCGQSQQFSFSLLFPRQNSSIKKPALQGSQLGRSMQYSHIYTGLNTQSNLHSDWHLITSQKEQIKSSRDRKIEFGKRVESSMKSISFLMTSDGLNSFCMQTTHTKKSTTSFCFPAARTLLMLLHLMSCL